MRHGAVIAAALVAVLFAALLIPGGQRNWVLNLVAGNGFHTVRWPPTAPQPAAPPIRVAISAMISPERTYLAYGDLFGEVAQRCGRRLELIQRPTYAQVNELLMAGLVDVAWICTGAWPDLARTHAARLAVVPVIGGRTTYQAYVIVATAGRIRAMADLRGARFAFTDPLSLTGYAFPKHLVVDLGSSPETFFAGTIFTHAHDNSIEAVRRGLVDAASVDSLVFEFMREHSPESVAGLEVIERSPPFPVPPVVVSAASSPDLLTSVETTMRALNQDAMGRGLLLALGIERFERADEAPYAGVQ